MSDQDQAGLDTSEVPGPDWLGILLPEIYDGASIWQRPDGTYLNRWSALAAEHPGDASLAWRRDRAQEWIEQAMSEETRSAGAT